MSNSTRGYFELGNYQNGFTPSGLLESWPTPEDMASDFKDYEGAVDGSVPPSDTAAQRDTGNHVSWPIVPGFKSSIDDANERRPTPGPLITTALAMFGHSSAFFIATNATNLTTNDNYKRMCRDTVLPFSMLMSMSFSYVQIDICSRDRSGHPTNQEPKTPLDLATDETLLPELVYNFINIFSNANRAKELLTIALFFASEIHLTTTASLGSSSLNSCAIYTGDGSQILKPRYGLAGIIVVSLLIAIQVAGLVILAIYNSSFPTWTPNLDALALAKVGAELKDLGLSPIGRESHGDAAKLASASGLVGVVDDDKEMVTLLERSPGRDAGDDETAPENTHGDIEPQNIGSEKQLRLGLGSTGLISKDLAAKATNGKMNRRTRDGRGSLDVN
ncbi:hypothetical protein VE00_06369 [Pseudogymnoascus sp. WSF 3629]|nr:hypothetical protein VE00_06369 [Pseudogymnoascus sp. WSF 3629]